MKLYIKEWCRYQGLLQREVANTAKISPEHLSKIATGKMVPRVKTLDKIAEAIGTTSKKLYKMPV